ncbi:MAG: glucosamine-6-phosphate deaminase [Propionibacteriaceae bacterium]|jgi:glucosamine-6-phosphate deaminase|nr:glucosamine-6-phosphate deaminase [Propionibacteriaceae bacterium]
MDVIICKNDTEVGAYAAAKIAKVARQVGSQVTIGVATGSSPLRTYQALAAMVAAGQLDLSQGSAFALDEYVGLPFGHPQTYHEVIRKTVTEPLGLDPARVHCPNGFAEDLRQACADYEAAIKQAGGVDIQILGLGSNGHIGFNEPTSSLNSRTRIKTLTEQTRKDNQRFFASLDEVPRHCLTQGLGTIMAARHVVLVANGKNKAAAVKSVIEGPITAMFPGSVLQMHQWATIIIDEAAATELELADYYRQMYDNLPDWQRVMLPTGDVG